MATIASGDWTRSAPGALPPVGIEVETMDGGGHVQTLAYKDGLWWAPDFSIYVYYTPMFWREVTA